MGNDEPQNDKSVITSAQVIRKINKTRLASPTGCEKPQEEIRWLLSVYQGKYAQETEASSSDPASAVPHTLVS